MIGKDYYQVLGIPRSASEDDIKKAHRKLARKFHPDLNPGDKKAEERFKEIQQAYDILSEPQKRAQYDRFGDPAAQAPFGWRPGSQPPGPGTSFTDRAPGAEHAGGSINLEEIFERMFGGLRGGSRTTEQAQPGGAPAEDVEFGLDITLEEAFRGVSKRINLSLQDVCRQCGGFGHKRSGKGVFDFSQTCPRCGGHGRIPSPRTGEVAIPPGAWEDLRLKLAGQGAADERDRRGDLYVRLHIRPHELFERTGQDLLFDVDVPYTVASLGGEAKVRMLDGQVRDLIIPPGVRSGQKLRLAGQGMPGLQGRKQGDAYARVRITVSRAPGERETALLRELAAIRKDPVAAVRTTR